jgi:hypothetical protein
MGIISIFGPGCYSSICWQVPALLHFTAGALQRGKRATSQTGDGAMSSKAAIQLAGNASSIFQAWLDLKRQTSSNSTNNVSPSNNAQQKPNSPP